MKKIVFMTVLGLFISANSAAQLNADQLIRVNNVANINSMNAINSPNEGSLVYVESDDNLYIRKGNNWSTIWTNRGNSATNTCFIGPISNHDFKIRTNNAQRMVVENDGDVGIQVNSPIATFQVNTASASNFINVATHGTASCNNGNDPEDAIDNDPNSTGWWNGFSPSFWSWDWLTIDLTSINLNEPVVRYTLRSEGGQGEFFNPTIWRIQGSLDGNNWTTLHSIDGANTWNWGEVTYNFNNSVSYNLYRILVHRGNIHPIFGWNPVFTVTDFNLFIRDTTDLTDDFLVAHNGNVGVGINPTQKLHVNGDTRVEGDIFATGNITPDYVFENYFEGKSERNPEYEFTPIEKAERFVKKNKHLPGVPSAADIEKQGGIIVNRATEINLEKIEEVYLYIFELNDRIDKLEEELSKCKRPK